MTSYRGAQEYLAALETSLSQAWTQAYYSGSLSTIEKLALLHPDHLDQVALPKHQTKEKIQKKIQGPRQFSHEFQEKCGSELLWGYPCHLKGDLQQDHLFPYSLGGPTLGTNRLWLCRYHNMVKTCDIHCFPWGDVETRCGAWLDGQIEQLHSRVFSRYS